MPAEIGRKKSLCIKIGRKLSLTRMLAISGLRANNRPCVRLASGLRRNARYFLAEPECALFLVGIRMRADEWPMNGQKMADERPMNGHVLSCAGPDTHPSRRVKDAVKNILSIFPRGKIYTYKQTKSLK